MRIVVGGALQLESSSGECQVEKQPTQDGFGFSATVYDRTGTQQAWANVPSLGFVDVQPQGQGPFRVELVALAAESHHIEVTGVGADDTVCVVNGPSTATAGLCSAPPR